MLFDFYASLLTKTQREYMELYYIEDYSLGEIANEKQVSRQAAYDNIKRSEKVLETYEKKLSLYDKFIRRQQLLADLTLYIEDDIDSKELLSIVKQLKNID